MAEVSRANALALINQGNSNEIWQEAAQTSAALKTFRKIRMGSKQQRMPVLDVLASASFLAGDDTADNRRKPTTSVEWTNKMLEVEEIACIVPIHENVFDDSSFNVWNEVRPLIAEAVGVALDGAVFFGTNKPASWPNSLEDGARAAGNVVSRATVTAANGDLAEALNQAMGVVEADGFDPNIFYSHTPKRTQLRGLRDDNGQPIYLTSLRDGGPVDRLMGVPIEWVRNGAWIDANAGAGAEFITGDATKAILGIRQDIEFKILDQATLTTGTGAGRVVSVSLAEEDMIALRCKMRVAFQVADPTTREGGSAAYPFAILDD